MNDNLIDIETEKLPVSVFANDELKAWFKNISQVMARLEAEVNFQTMLAGWFGNEELLPQMEVCFTSATGFVSFQQEDTHLESKQLADDVFYRFDTDKKRATGFIHFTESELSLIEQHQKLLPGIAKAKLVKLLRDIGQTLNLPPVPTLN